MEATAEQAEEVEVPAKSGGSKLVPILLVLNMLLVGGVLAVVLLGLGPAAAPPHPKDAPHGEAEGSHGASGEHGEEGAEGDEGAEVTVEQLNAGSGPTIALEDFVVQLRNPEAARYVRVGFELEVAGEKEKAAVEKRRALVRDTFISFLSDLTVEELKGSDGINRMKEQLLRRLDKVLPGRPVRAIYVTDFVVQ